QTCDRACLKTTLDQYLNAVTKRDPSAAPLFLGFRQTEDGAVVKLGMRIAESRDVDRFLNTAPPLEFSQRPSNSYRHGRNPWTLVGTFFTAGNSHHRPRISEKPRKPKKVRIR